MKTNFNAVFMVLIQILLSGDGLPQSGYVDFYMGRNYEGALHRVFFGDPGVAVTIPRLSGNFDTPTLLSWKIVGQNIAAKVELTETMIGRNGNPYPFMFLYSEENEPEVGGTEQYGQRQAILKCVVADLPQPQLFIPVDRSNINPGATPSQDLVPGHRQLFIRRAFFWENSEQLVCELPFNPHGPYGDIKINICDPFVLTYRKEQLRGNPDLWKMRRYPEFIANIPGPIWYADACGPNPHSEWIDGPWGCNYSNVAIYDYDKENFPDEICVLVSEADGTNDEDFLGYLKVTRDIPPGVPIILKASMFGWVILENLDVEGAEPSVNKGDLYWYGGWDGKYPEIVQGPITFIVNNFGFVLGSQYVPYTDTQFFEQRQYRELTGRTFTIGLLGGSFPAGTYSEKMIFEAIRTPAVFGKR